MKIVYYISGHGFGHISRSFEIIKAFLEKGAEIVLVTDRKGFLLEIPSNIRVREKSTDIGILQKNSLDIDIENTILNINNFIKNYNKLYHEEKEFLLSYKPDFLFSDSSSFPFPIASELKIPAYFVGNFTWDFIYRNYASQDTIFVEFAKTLQAEYSLTTKGFILPFHCPMDSIPNKQFVGLVGRKPLRSRKKIREDLGFTEEKKYLLFSFGAYGLDPKLFQYQNLASDLQIVVSRFEGFRPEYVLRLDDIHYPDLVLACDFVVTKPGYGILAESYFSNSPVIYTDRGDFAEYPYLVEALKREFRSAYISQTDLYNFNFRVVINDIRQQYPLQFPEKKNGVAEILCNFF